MVAQDLQKLILIILMIMPKSDESSQHPSIFLWHYAYTYNSAIHYICVLHNVILNRHVPYLPFILYNYLKFYNLKVYEKWQRKPVDKAHITVITPYIYLESSCMYVCIAYVYVFRSRICSFWIMNVSHYYKIMLHRRIVELRIK